MSAIPTAEIIDAFYLCLAASIIWAPLVFLGAAFINRKSGGCAESTVWPSALIIAASPVIAAPIAASLGLSIRASKPLPPMAAPETVFNPAAALISPTPVQGPAIELATVLNAVADLYFYGFVLFAALGVMRLAGFSYQIRHSYPVDDARLLDGLRDWRRLIGVRGPVRFAYSNAVSSVCVHGFLRPVVLMPPSLLERVSTDDAILMGAHELAHIKRRDTWLFAFCGLAKALFWFNPFMRRIVAHAQLAAEQAADALVIRRGVNRKSYARCFVESLKIASNLSARQHAFVPSFTPFDKRSRRERLDAILSGRIAEPVLSAGGKAALVASGLIALGLAFGQAALAVAPPPAKDALTVVPVDGRVTSKFGERNDPISQEKSFHRGMDIAAATGTSVRAAGAGKVIDATGRYNDETAWGNIVVIDHGHGLVTRYAQLDSYIVRKGDTVKAGDTIGAVGATGRATGPHLHFEVLADGENIDPAPVVVPDAPAAPKLRRIRKVDPAPAAPGVFIEPAPPAVAPPAPAVPEAAPDVDNVVDPAPMPAPKAPPAPEDLSFGERLELRLAGPLTEWAEKIEDDISFLDWPSASVFVEDDDSFTVQIGDIELQGIGDAEALADALKDSSFEFENWPNIEINTPRFAFAFDGYELSDEDRKAIEKAREKAARAAEKVRRQSKRHMERAKRSVERALERAKRDHEYAMDDVERDEAVHMEEMLALREEALREAAETIAQERAELERLRAELAAEKINED